MPGFSRHGLTNAGCQNCNPHPPWNVIAHWILWRFRYDQGRNGSYRGEPRYASSCCRIRSLMIVNSLHSIHEVALHNLICDDNLTSRQICTGYWTGWRLACSTNLHGTLLDRLWRNCQKTSCRPEYQARGEHILEMDWELCCRWLFRGGPNGIWWASILPMSGISRTDSRKLSLRDMQPYNHQVVLKSWWRYLFMLPE